ncbi:Tn3 family transposase [Escherichia coli]
MGSCAAPSAKGDDKFITTDYLQQCRGLNLVTAAIVLWNTVYLERAAHALRGNGHAVDDSLLQYLSPLGWEHINLTGDYLWRSSAKIGAGKFRPLRPLQPA